MNTALHDESTWRQADQVLDSLLDLPDAQRDGRLAALDLAPPVRTRAAQLLAAHRRGEGVLEQPLPAASDAEALRGRRLGRWIIEDELGRGGMAVVFRARSAEAPAGQVAALKLLTLGALARDGLRRFREEQDLLARLRHPHIAALIDSGVSDEGTPWFAMTLVEGQRIDMWCRTRRLDMRARVRLFLDVCAAVDHAHRALVIHRDLKPSNVLVDDGGHVHLLDFGIARIVQEGEPTQTHKRALTPQYAAPEQFRGALPSTAMDVYGLGALLYAMLTGAPPRAAADAPDATPTLPSLAIARGVELGATELARARRALRGDLDAVILQALATDPERRYAGAAALAADLRRWLDGRAVEARVPSLGYRVAKFVRRHRLGVAAAAMVLIALAAGAAGTWWQAVRARAQARRALDEAQRADAVRDFLLGLFQASDPEHNGGKVPDLFAILANGAERARQPGALPARARAELLASLGVIYRNLARLKEAEALLDASIALYASDASIPSAERYAPSLSRIPLLISLGRTGEAVESARALLAAIRADASAPRDALVTALLRLGDARVFAGADDPAASADARESVALARVLDPPEPESLAMTLHTLAMIERNRDELVAAETAAREAIGIFEGLGAEGQNGLRAALVTLASILSDLQRHDEALTFFQRGLEVTRRMYAPEHVFVGRTLNTYATELLTDGRFDEAQAALTESIAIQRKALGNVPRLAPALFNMAWLREAQGDDAAAKALLDEALALQQKDRADDERVLQIKAALAHAHARLAETESARSLFDEVERGLKQLSGGALHSRVQIKSALRLAHFRVDSGDAGAASEWLDALQAAFARDQRPLDAQRIEADLLHAQAAQAQGRAAEANAAWQRALTQLRGIPREMRYFAYEHYLTAAHFALSLGDKGAAAELVAQSESALTPEHVVMPRLAAQRAQLLAAVR